MAKKNIIVDDNMSWVKALSVTLLKNYIKYFPIKQGKGIIRKTILGSLLPENYIALTPNDAKIRVAHNTEIGRLIYFKDRFFEEAEIQAVCEYAGNGVAVDIGANIGIYTVSFAKEMKQKGTIWAFEPIPSNAEKIKENIRLNDFDNCKVFETALGNEEGFVSFLLSNDPAYASKVEVVGYASGATANISITKLDTVWAAHNKPVVSILKIDVEGLETEVLKGADDLIKTCKPVILLEANTAEYLEKLVKLLAPHGYTYSQPSGFEKWNYLFTSRA